MLLLVLLRLVLLASKGSKGSFKLLLVHAKSLSIMQLPLLFTTPEVGSTLKLSSYPPNCPG